MHRNQYLFGILDKFQNLEVQKLPYFGLHVIVEVIYFHIRASAVEALSDVTSQKLEILQD